MQEPIVLADTEKIYNIFFLLIRDIFVNENFLQIEKLYTLFWDVTMVQQPIYMNIYI